MSLDDYDIMHRRCPTCDTFVFETNEHGECLTCRPGYSADELAFLNGMYEQPDNEFLPLVYADWLDDQGDERGTIVRKRHESGKTFRRRRGRDSRVNELLREIETWLEQTPHHWHRTWHGDLLSIEERWAKVLNCGAPFVAQELTPARRFAHTCENSWRSMVECGSDETRHCTNCNQQVHYCSSKDVADGLVRAGYCIAVPVEVLEQADHEHGQRAIISGGAYQNVEQVYSEQVARLWGEALFQHDDVPQARYRKPKHDLNEAV